MDILMPKVGLTMTEGVIVDWHKRPGDWVRQGEVLFTFETEKSTLDFESPAEGLLTDILVPTGQPIPCLTPVAAIRQQTTDDRQQTTDDRQQT
ncbi:MAG: lipoyl domain-containing protein, partial [Candidatus Roseilinea sp.]|uniref:lipoyl domain-containing protein n=1 Tax=Candidatus Roseilinea sp. TaxID=2838777 RepID=UPI00404AB8C6